MTLRDILARGADDLVSEFLRNHSEWCVFHDAGAVHYAVQGTRRLGKSRERGHHR